MPPAVAQWLAMGKYAAFVWPAYAVAFVVLGGLAGQTLRRHRLSADLVARLKRRDGARE